LLLLKISFEIVRKFKDLVKKEKEEIMKKVEDTQEKKKEIMRLLDEIDKGQVLIIIYNI